MRRGSYIIIQHRSEKCDGELSLPVIGHVAFALLLGVLSSHTISPSPNREALSIESVRLKFLVESLITVISNVFAVKPDGRVTSAGVSPTDITSWSPVGSTTRRRTTPLTSQVKRSGSDGFTPPVVHASVKKLATAVASVRTQEITIILLSLPLLQYYNILYPGQAKTSKKPQGIISGVGMLEGNITLPTRNLEGNITLPTRNREGNIRNAINYRPVNVHRTHRKAMTAVSCFIEEWPECKLNAS